MTNPRFCLRECNWSRPEHNAQLFCVYCWNSLSGQWPPETSSSSKGEGLQHLGMTFARQWLSLWCLVSGGGVPHRKESCVDQLRTSCEQCLSILWRQPGTLQVCSRCLCLLLVSWSGETLLPPVRSLPQPHFFPDSLTLTRASASYVLSARPC